MAYSCTPSGATDATSGPPRRGSARLPAARERVGEATNRPLGGEHETKDRPATGWNAADGFAAPGPTQRLRGVASSRPSALRRSQEGFHFAVLPLNTRKLPSADTEGHGSFSTSSLRPLRPLRLKATIPFPCFQCIPWLNNPPRLSFSPAGPQAAPFRVPRRGFLCFQW